MRQRMQQQQQASAKNQRLALQMANRPAVQAALKLKKVRASFIHNNKTRKKSVNSFLFLFRKACSSAWACSRGWVCVDAVGECEAEDGADSEAQVAVSRWIEEMARFKTTEVGSEEIFAYDCIIIVG